MTDPRVANPRAAKCDPMTPIPAQPSSSGAAMTAQPKIPQCTACQYCGAVVKQSQSSIRRAIREGKPLYCNRVCSGMARRVPSGQKKEAKRVYDARRRAEHAAEISAWKAAYYQRTRDPAKERERRRANMGRHVEYCRRPEYVAYKADYDRQLRADEYGDFAEAYLLLLDLEREIRSRSTGYERRKARGYYTRTAQQRRRELWQATTARN